MMKKSSHVEKQHMPGAGFFTQPPSKINVAHTFDTDDALDKIDTIERSIKAFISCSGMHTLKKEIEKVQTGDCDEVVLQALLLGPKATLEDVCAILNNNAVYATLFLSSTLGLLFSPPDLIASRANNDGLKAVYFAGICCSVFFMILK